MSDAPAPRAMRLTDNRLDDLQELVKVADENIEYLKSALQDYDHGHVLHGTLSTRLNKLERAREWLVSKIAAERAHRGGA